MSDHSHYDEAAHAVFRAPVCRCGHRKTVHAGVDANGRCALRSCGCGRFEQKAAAAQPAPGLVERLRAALAEAASHVEPVDQNSELAIAEWLELSKETDQSGQFPSTGETRHYSEPQPAPELAARRTAAAAVLADYTNGAGTADPDALSMAAGRLADGLGRLLAELDAGDRAAAEFPAAAAQLAEVRAVLDAFDWETSDRQYALEKVDDIVNGRTR